MGLLLRPEVYYAESPDGMYLLTHEGPADFTGGSVYALLERLAPYLNGRHGLDDLTASLAPERRQQVEQLLRTLQDSGAIREISGEPPADTGTGVQQGRDPDARYLGYFHEDGEEMLAAYRAKVALVIGSGRLLIESAVAAARTGLTVTVVNAGECPVDRDALSARLARIRDDGAGTVVRDLPGELTSDVAHDLVSGVDVVVHASDRTPARHTRLLERVCAVAGVPVAQALAHDGTAWIAPVGANWSCGWRRLVARRRDGPPGPGGWSTEMSDHAARVVATQLLHGVFRWATGLDGEDVSALTRVDLRTLQSDRHPYHPHPFTAMRTPAPDTERGMARRIAALDAGPELSEDDFSRRAASCVGELLGMLAEPDERDFAQSPLHVCGVEVSDPVGLWEPTGPAPMVVGAGIDFATARYRAALRAFALYGSLMVDPRRLLAPDGSPFCAPDGDPEPALAAIRAGHAPARIRGHGLGGGARMLDARVVFPVLDRHAPPPGPPAGAAAGYRWQDAVETGLLDHCHRRALADLAAAAPLPRIDPDPAQLDATAQRYRRLLAATGAPATFYDASGARAVPVVVCCLAGEPAGSSCGVTVADAVRGAMEQALLHSQARTTGQAAYAPTPPPLPERLRGTEVRPVAAGSPLSVAALADALAAGGSRPLVVPLDHDPQASDAMPYVVRVVPADA